MRIFISYAREQENVAESIHVRLLQEGHQSFIDKSRLAAGEQFDAKIRHAIDHSDLLIFLISPDSVRLGTYARSELKFAQDRWPNPSGRVLPVMVETTPHEEIPPYLTATTILPIQGNVTADVLAEVSNIARRRHSVGRRWLLPASGVAAIAALTLFGGFYHRDTACYLDATISAKPGVDVTGLMLDVLYDGSTNTVLASQTGTALLKVGPLQSKRPAWMVTLRAPDGKAIGTATLDGCAVTVQERQINEAYRLKIVPRS